jgi:DNA-binding PadR family transcriptional regulator
LGYALLSLLTRGPATGYQLSKKMKRPIGYFWAASHSQIYPELARLAALGYVDIDEGAGPGPRAKKTYTVTEAGRAALRDWLILPPVSQPRSEITLKAYAATCAPSSAMAELYQRHADECAADLSAWQKDAEAQQSLGKDDPAHPEFGSYAVLMMGIESRRASLRWAGWMASVLREGR